MNVPLSHSWELQPILEETLRAAGRWARAPRWGCFGCQERRRIIVEDVEGDPGDDSLHAMAHAAGFRAVHCTPLVTRSGQVIGVLSTHFREPHRPTIREMHLADLCARQAVDFIENGRLYAELRDADRSKNEFLATRAHEPRNPLAPIRNAVQILHLKAEPSPEVQWALEVVARQMEQMPRLVDDLGPGDRPPPVARCGVRPSPGQAGRSRGTDLSAGNRGSQGLGGRRLQMRSGKYIPCSWCAPPDF